MPQVDKYVYITGTLVDYSYVAHDGKAKPRRGSDFAITIRDSRGKKYTAYTDKGVIQLADYMRNTILGITQIRIHVKIDRQVLWWTIYELNQLEIID